MLNRIIDLTDIGPHDTQMAVIQYGSFATVEFPFNAHASREQLRKAVNEIKHRSGE